LVLADLNANDVVVEARAGLLYGEVGIFPASPAHLEW